MTDDPTQGVRTAPAAAEPTQQLVREVVHEIRSLVRLEVALAREDLKSDVAHAKAAGTVLGTAGALGVSGFSMLMVAIGLALPKPWLAVLIMAGMLFAVAGALALRGWKAMPRKPLSEMRERLQSDLKSFNKRVA